MTTPRQGPRRGMCGTVSMHEYLLELDPDFRERSDEIEQQIGDAVADGRASRKRQQLTTIPTVVHVLWSSDDQNISQDQIQSQIEVLNADFRAQNKDKVDVPDCWTGLVADANVEFVLASTDPDGGATDGIIRKRTDVTSFTVNDRMKSDATGGSDAWPTDRYLNLWVCNLGDVLGYAQFPGGPADTDGVVILTSAFGTSGTATAPYDLGRTATHEVGHWLNLRHIWGDKNDCSGSDEVDDTPTARRPNFGRPTFPHVTCGNGPNGDMFVNYMDYTDDAVMVMFTAGQAERMNAALDIRGF
ncbi:zinc metalloprotease [Actinomycetospora aeridis]|uniref:Zinc metalloprotease n=1 Tax=Actinomycetospora aeridis TaxID=3129231 RepID=A0ABU8N7N1_9PSEU